MSLCSQLYWNTKSIFCGQQRPVFTTTLKPPSVASDFLFPFAIVLEAQGSGRALAVQSPRAAVLILSSSRSEGCDARQAILPFLFSHSPGICCSGLMVSWWLFRDSIFLTGCPQSISVTPDHFLRTQTLLPPSLLPTMVPPLFLLLRQHS